MARSTSWLTALCICLGCAFAYGTDMDTVVHDVCGKRIALLGESPSHGYGRTMQFKAELVRRLVDECHFDAFFIESGIYDFINIRRALDSGQPTTDSMIAAAIGGLWATKEVDPLIPFLRERAQAGKLALGGLDDQLGRGTYAQRAMSADLVDYLQGDAKAQCLAILQRHMLYQYDDKSPYGPKDNALITGCLSTIGKAIAKAESRPARTREYDTAMIESLKRSFARDFPVSPPAGDARDHSMYLNFQWLLSHLHLPARSKVIVWTATNHAAKNLSGVPGLERYLSMGSLIQREFKDESFTLGFSAYAGSYGMARQPARQLGVAPSDSLEGQAFAKSDADTRYLPLSELRRLGAVAARPLGSDFKTAKWDEVLDGLLIFREEHPPDFARH